MRRVAWAAAAGAAAVVLVVLVSGGGGHGDRRGDGGGSLSAPAAPRTSPARVGQVPVPAAIDDATIAQVLDEELVVVSSDLRVAELVADEPQPCAGRPVWLRARTEGDAGEGRLVSRWIWATGSRLSMQPGASVRFTPPEAGLYPIRFQVVRGLGGKRIGVLAETTLTLQAVDCGSGPAPLRVESIATGGRVDFTAVAGVSTRGGFTWDFGDGQTQTTDGPTVRHDYPILELGADEVRDYRVTVQVAAADGARLRAASGVTLRGQARPPLPPAIAAELGDAIWDESARRWQRRIEVDNRERPAIVWERGERHSLHEDDRITTRTLTVAELLAISEARDDGGFVATVAVSAAETTPDVRRITDRLHGRDASGEPATLTWVAWDRDDFTPDPAAPAPPRRRAEHGAPGR